MSTLYQWRKKARIRFEKAERFVNARNDKQRIALFVGALLILLLFWDAVALTPQRLELVASSATTVRLDKELKTKRDSLLSVKETLKTDPLQAKKVYKITLMKQLELLNAEFKKLTSNLVRPEQMRELLKDLMAKVPGLTLVSLKSGKSQPLIENDTSVSLYRHSTGIVFKGEFFPAIRYLESLEGGNMRILWTSLSMNVAKYPDGDIELVISTLSDDEGWIGV